MPTDRPSSDQVELDFDAPQPKNGPSSPKVYQVAEIVRLAARKLEAGFGDIWVEGEVSNLRTSPSGHVYFTLKDAKAQLSVVMFRSTVRRLKFHLEDGQMLRCRGSLGIYDAQGRFQLTAQTAEPAGGVGALQLAFEQLKRKLQAEGLFDERHKKATPLLPRTIAVVTSPTGAALRDILRVLHNRCPVRVVLCPTLVQGSDAPPEIVQALAWADGLAADLIIVGRGGGSLEDLWAFNTEPVARAIFATRTPIISAVGHEVDVTIADLVADRRAPTPSGAAEMAVPVMSELQQALGTLHLRAGRAMRQQLVDRALRLERLRRALGTPHALVNRGRMALDDATTRMQASMTRSLGQRREALIHWHGRLSAQEPRVRLGRDRASLVDLHTRLLNAARRCLTTEQAKLTTAMARLESLSPLSVLSRGYTLVLDQQRSVVRDPRLLQRGERIGIKFHRGEVVCTVEEVLLSDDEP
jgi:exodeoxyribonuclease VII large subunit